MFFLRFELLVFLALGLFWVCDLGTCENDYNTCSFHYWKVDWYTAVKICKENRKELLCYKSRKEIDDITEAFRLSAFGDAELEIWMSYRSCSYDKMEECLSLHIQKSKLGVWHYFQSNCSRHFPFICCINGTEHLTSTSLMTPVPSHSISDIWEQTSGTKRLLSSTTDSVRFLCKKVRRRGVLWPDTEVGKWAVKPCPGKSVGTARWYCENMHGGKWKEGGPDMKECKSLEIRYLKEKFNSSLASELIIELEKVFYEKDKEMFGEDLADVIYMMKALPSRLYEETGALIGASRWTSTRDSIAKSMSVLDRIMELNATWKDIEEDMRSGVGTHLLTTVDEMGALLGAVMVDDTKEQSIIGRNVALQVMKPKPNETVNLPEWTVTSDYSHQGNIILKEGFDAELDPKKGNVTVVFTLYSDMTLILSPSEKQEQDNKPSSLNSAVLSATVTQARRPTAIQHEVRILLEHLTPNPNASACVFWNIKEDRWSTEGCRLDGTNGSYTLCVCNHLTNFALLMDYREVMDEVNQLPFHYITLIGCIVSIISLAVCVVVFTCYSYHTRHSWGLRYVIHRNLCLTLLIANTVLIFGLDKTEDRRTCAVVAGLLHYFFLSAFSWMLLEGVHIYMLLVIVFAFRRSHSEKYYLFGYGFPLVVVTITAIVRPTYYGTDEICWLSVEKGTIWGFMGPVAGILLCNTAALMLAQWKASNISTKDDNVALAKRWLRVTFILFPVLGITWLFGFLYVGKHFEVAGYLFAIFNSLQGFCIFIFHCLLDKKARNMVITSFKKKSASVNTGSSGTQKKLRDPRQLQNNAASNSATPPQSDNEKKPSVFFHLPFRNTCKRDWTIWKKPWSFCFDMPVSENGNNETQPNEEPPKAVIVQWNNLETKNC